MVALDFLTAGIISIFYISLGQLPLVPLMIVVLMLLYGISGAYQPSVQASIPLLVEYEVLAKGNATINMVSTLSNLLGPVIGGVLFGYFGLTPILFLSIICFVISAVMEIFIHIPHQKRKAETGIFVTVRNDLKDSFRSVSYTHLLRFKIWTYGISYTFQHQFFHALSRDVKTSKIQQSLFQL